MGFKVGFNIVMGLVRVLIIVSASVQDGQIIVLNRG